MHLLFASSIIASFVNPILTGMIVTGSLVCVLCVTWAGFMYITSSGNPNKLAKAKQLIVRALLGLVIIIGASAFSLILIHAYSAKPGPVSAQLPPLKAISNQSSSGNLVDVLIKTISGLLVAVVATVSRPFIDALNYFTKATPLLNANSNVVHLWAISTSIADALLVLVIAIIGFHIMGSSQFGFGDVNLATIIPQILITFVLINGSLYLIDGIIQLSNVMITALRAGSGNITPWNSLLSIISHVSGYSIAALFILVILMVFTVILLVYYISRIVVIYLGGVLAPFIFLLWLLPGFRDFAQNVFKTYLSTIFVLFVHVIILTLAASLLQGVLTSGGGVANPIMALLLGLATLIALIKTQGVLMQLNYASIGPKTVRKLGGSFINGVSFVALAASGNVAPALGTVAKGVSNIIPQPKPLHLPSNNDLANENKQGLNK